MFRLLLFLPLLTLILGQISYEYQYRRGDEPLGCTDEKGAFRKLGEIWTERKSCIQRNCLPGAFKIIVQIKRCPKIEPSENCTIKAGNGNNFPDCCKSLVC
uniref:SVWC domain-containing protein n=1 Tax=Rhodnius prolixus TaxID=13249 RepID=T1HWC9_RHOPR